MHPFDVGDRCVVDGIPVSFERPLFLFALTAVIASSTLLNF
jgi:hypothetical protein